MTDSPAPNGLRAARAVRGWSLTTEAEQIVELGRARGQAVATVASLRSQISRWENGHALPDPQYRELLSDLLGHTPADLGIGGPGPTVAGSPSGRLRAAIAAATAVDGSALQLWREQLASARRLDDELGATGAGSLVRAQVEVLEEALIHTVDAAARVATAGVLSAAAELAGAQALDGGAPDEAWRRYERARSAAVVAGDLGAEVLAAAGQAAVLVEVGEPAAALQALGAFDDLDLPAGGQNLPLGILARLAAARGEATAAMGDGDAAREAVDEATALAGRITVDVAHPGMVIELADISRWRGHVLARLRDGEAAPALREALDAGQRAVRHRAALHADLAAVLATVDAERSVAEARTARDLAERIGATRISAAVKPLTGGSR